MTSAENLLKWRTELLRYVHRLTGDPELAEDIAQDALLRLHSAGVARIDNPRAWLYRAATNLVRDTARRHATARQYTPCHEVDAPATPEQELERRESIAAVRRALDSLPPRDRELLILRESGFRYREIAEVIGVKSVSVPVLAARALDRFRAAYREKEQDETP